MKALTLLLGLFVSLIPTAGLHAQDEYNNFLNAFNKALKFDDQPGLMRAISGREPSAITHFEYLMMTWIRKKEEDDTRVALDKLKVAFNKLHGCKVLDHVEAYYNDVDNDRVHAMVKAETNRATLYNKLRAYGIE